MTLITIVDDNWSATMFKAVEGPNDAVAAEEHTAKGRKGSWEKGSSKKWGKDNVIYHHTGSPKTTARQ